MGDNESCLQGPFQSQTAFHCTQPFIITRPSQISVVMEYLVLNIRVSVDRAMSSSPVS